MITPKLMPINHHSNVLSIGNNDLAQIIRADFTHKKIITCASTIYMNPFFTIAAKLIIFSLQLSSQIKHYQLSLHASSLGVNPVLFTWSFTPWFSFHLCVQALCIAFGLVLLFGVAFGTPYCAFAHAFNPISPFRQADIACDSSSTVHLPLEK